MPKYSLDFHPSFLSGGASLLALTAALAFTLPAYAQDAPAAEEEVVVTGFRASLANAINIKRNESGLVDAINAEDIADFPDLNLAESLQRIPGVAITRRSGEGRQVSVRGLGPDYTRVRINGMEAMASSSGTPNSGGTNRGRGFDFNIFSSDLFNNLVVRKSATADVDEGSLGATVDLRTMRPFDFDEPRFVVNAQASSNELAGDVTPGVSFLATDTWFDGMFGALLSVSYDERHLIEEGHNITRWTYGGSNGGWNTASTVPGLTIADINRTVTASSDPALAMYHPRIPAYASYDTNADRLGVALSLQFRPDPTTEFSFDALVSHVLGERLEAQLQALGLSRPGTGKPQSIIRTGELSGNNLIYAEIDNVDLRTQSSRNVLDTLFQQYTLSATHDFSDSFRVNAMAGYASSEFEDPVYTIITFERLNSQDFVYDFRQRLLGMNLNFDATDPNNWGMINGSSEIRLRPEGVDNFNSSLKFDAEWDVTDSFRLSAGVDWKEFRFNAFEGTRANTLVVPEVAPGADLAALAEVFQFSEGLDLPAGSVSTWLRPNIDAVAAEFDIYSGTGMWTITPNITVESEVSEETLGFWAQANFDFDLLGLRWRGDAGVRQFNTTQRSSGFASVGATLDWVTVEREYDFLLPSANLAVELTDTLIARASAAQTIARPSLDSVTPGGNLTIQGATRNFSTGNPFVEPTQSNNLDFALEWYPNDGTLVSLGLFYKEIDTFVQTLRTEAVYTTLGLPNSLLDGTLATPDMVFAVTRPVNSDGGELTGFELNVQQPFTFLPGLLSDTGIIANYTHVNSEIEYLTSAVPGDRTINATLIGLSKEAWNVTLYYEGDRFSIRGSVAYRDGYLSAVPGNDFNSWHGANATTNVDMQASYSVTDNLRLTFEGINLTDEYADLYVDESNRQNTYTHTGKQFILSARYEF